MTDAYRPLLQFDTDSADFTRGFEAGHVWTTLCSIADVDGETFTVHWANAEMMLRMAEALGLVCAVTGPFDDEMWCQIVFNQPCPVMPASECRT